MLQTLTNFGITRSLSARCISPGTLKMNVSLKVERKKTGSVGLNSGKLHQFSQSDLIARSRKHWDIQDMDSKHK